MWNEASAYNWMVHHADTGVWLVFLITVVLIAAILERTRRSVAAASKGRA